MSLFRLVYEHVTLEQRGSLSAKEVEPNVKTQSNANAGIFESRGL